MAAPFLFLAHFRVDRSQLAFLDSGLSTPPPFFCRTVYSAQGAAETFHAVRSSL